VARNLFSLRTPLDLLRKLERESDRLRDAVRPTDQSDHFYNFCVSASAMKNYVFAALEVPPNDPNRRTWIRRWHSKCPRLTYCEHIATAPANDGDRAIPTGLGLRSIRIETAPTNVVAMRRPRNDLHPASNDDAIVKAPDLTREVTDFWRTELARLNLLR
jgi:hypothetical protein